MKKLDKFFELKKKYENGELSDTDHILFATNLKLERIRSNTSIMSFVIVAQFLLGIIVGFALSNL